MLDVWLCACAVQCVLWLLHSDIATGMEQMTLFCIEGGAASKIHSDRNGANAFAVAACNAVQEWVGGDRSEGKGSCHMLTSRHRLLIDDRKL